MEQKFVISVLKNNVASNWDYFLYSGHYCIVYYYSLFKDLAIIIYINFIKKKKCYGSLQLIYTQTGRDIEK